MRKIYVIVLVMIVLVGCSPSGLTTKGDEPHPIGCESYLHIGDETFQVVELKAVNGMFQFKTNDGRLIHTTMSGLIYLESDCEVFG